MSLSLNENGAGVYEVKNTKTGKLYIGSSRNIKKRWSHIISSLRGGYGQRVMQQEFLVHGEQSLQFTVLENVSELSTLKEREQFYLDHVPEEYKYNIAPTTSSTSGVCWSEESKNRQSAMASKRNVQPEYNKMLSERAKQQWKERRPEMEEYAARGREAVLPLNEKQRKDLGDRLRVHIASQTSEEMARRSSCRDMAALSKAMKERWQNPEFRVMMIAKNGRRRK